MPTVIITGASRGLGKAVALLLTEMGAEVTLNARSAEMLKQVAEEIRQAGGPVLVVPGDVTQPGTAERLIGATVAQYGRIDAVINNAGVLEPVTRIAESRAGDWQRLLAVNLLGPLLVTQAALTYLREARGRVVNISSSSGVNPKVAWGAYCASKAALNMFTSVLALEEPLITALAAHPGAVDTDMQADLRRVGKGHMTDTEHARFVRMSQEGALLPPHAPGRAIAALALYAPPTWSGEFVSWNEDRVAALMRGRA
jgi:NAD(P)-dependent dehydrogenase (short-subunit alcohol dehydrogenase family)